MKSELLTWLKELWLYCLYWKLCGCVCRFTLNHWHEGWCDLQTIWNNLFHLAARKEKDSCTLFRSQSHISVRTLKGISFTFSLFPCFLCQVDSWFSVWLSEIQHWEEMKSDRAHIRCFTVRRFCQGKQQTTNRFTETLQPGQHINKMNNVSGGKWEEQRRQGSAVFVLWSMPYIVHEFPMNSR